MLDVTVPMRRIRVCPYTRHARYLPMDGSMPWARMFPYPVDPSRWADADYHGYLIPADVPGSCRRKLRRSHSNSSSNCGSVRKDTTSASVKEGEVENPFLQIFDLMFGTQKPTNAGQKANVKPPWKKTISLRGFSHEDVKVTETENHKIVVEAKKELEDGEFVHLSRQLRPPSGVNLQSLRVFFSEDGDVTLTAGWQDQKVDIQKENVSFAGHSGKQECPEVRAEKKDGQPSSNDDVSPESRKEDKRALSLEDTVRNASEEKQAESSNNLLQRKETSQTANDEHCFAEEKNTGLEDTQPNKDKQMSVDDIEMNVSEEKDAEFSINLVQNEETSQKSNEKQGLAGEKNTELESRKADTQPDKGEHEQLSVDDTEMDASREKDAESSNNLVQNEETSPKANEDNGLTEEKKVEHGGQRSYTQSGNDKQHAERQQKFSMTINLKEFPEESVDVKIDGKKIIVKAQHEEKTDDYSFTRVFRRSITLPEGVDPAKVKCRVDESGQLVMREAHEEE